MIVSKSITDAKGKQGESRSRQWEGLQYFLAFWLVLWLVLGLANVALAAGGNAGLLADAKVEPGTSAAEKAAKNAKGSEADESKTEASDEPLVLYMPRSRGQAKRSAAGGTRTASGSGAGLEIAILAPQDHIALTTRAQPTLYWFVSDRTDARIDITLVDPLAIDPLLEMTVDGPVEAGIHALDLAEHNLTLQPNRTYHWHVAVVQDASRRSTDTLVEGFIARTEVTSELERSLRDARQSYAPYALSGIWYDAVAELRQAISEEPKNRRLKLQEIALLEQADLSVVAGYALKAQR